MVRPADAKKTVRNVALFGIAGLTAVAAVVYLNAPARAPRAGVQTAVAEGPGTSAARAAPTPAAPNAQALPVSLSGTVPPHLPLDAHGHLAKVRAVRDFFDYFLTTRNEVSVQALDALVRRNIAAQLDGTAAQLEALDVWQRYMAYDQALDRASPLAPRSQGSGIDFDAMQTMLDQQAALASRTMGPEWSEAFFGAEWRRDHYEIAKLRIVNDRTLTEAQKAERLQALEQTLPPAERAALERQRQTRASIDAIASLQKQGLSTDELRARVTQTLGPQAAERVVQMQKGEDAWHAKYADYAQQRARIEAMGLSAADRDAQIAQLRQHVFTNSSEALRAASLDKGG